MPSPEVIIFVATTAVKLLLIPTYYSTDFDVHRNWLAITHSLPMCEWYTNVESEWTLDYPPFFAAFEWALSQIAQLVDPEMVVVRTDPYYSVRALLFQRLSVILSDVVFFAALRTYTSAREGTSTLFLAFANPGLLMVDHVHFQYNGLLFGILIFSLAAIRKGHDLLGGILFAVLLMWKHIFLYVAPLYFVYLLRHYCFELEVEEFHGYEQFNTHKHTRRFNLWRLVKLGSSVGLVFVVALGPFVAQGQGIQLLVRLFPFKRGLTHTYWAPNVWALYNVLDRALVHLTGATHVPRTTSGRAIETAHIVLPGVTPGNTVLLTALFMLPVLRVVWNAPHPRLFVSALAYCSICSFMLGWHVHEKAVLMATIPLALIAFDSIATARTYFFVATVGHYSLFPLLFRLQEAPIKVILLATHTYLSCRLLGRRLSASTTERDFLWCIIPIETFVLVIHPLLIAPAFPFLPLMTVSVFCAIGMLWGWHCCATEFFRRAALTVGGVRSFD